MAIEHRSLDGHQFEAVRAGAGIGICHDFMTARTELIRLFPELSVTRSYWTVWHENLRVARRVQVFADLLDKIVKEDRDLFRADP